MELFGLYGRIAVVTDCGGLASTDVAPLLADAGARIVLADRDRASSAAIARRIAEAGGEVLEVPTDVEQEAEVVALFERVRERFGRVDILVNCAGLTANQPLADTTSAIWDELHSLNLRATFLCMREAVRLMLGTGTGGRIVNITTIGAERPVLHGNAAYCASRGGVTQLTRSVAYDHAKDGILANVVLPGAVRDRTRIHASTQAALQDGHAFTGAGVDPDHLPLGMMKNPVDIAAAVLYLVGPSGSYITGQTLVLDGGFLIA